MNWSPSVITSWPRKCHGLTLHTKRQCLHDNWKSVACPRGRCSLFHLLTVVCDYLTIELSVFFHCFLNCTSTFYQIQIPQSFVGFEPGIFLFTKPTTHDKTNLSARVWFKDNGIQNVYNTNVFNLEYNGFLKIATTKQWVDCRIHPWQNHVIRKAEHILDALMRIWCTLKVEYKHIVVLTLSVTSNKEERILSACEDNKCIGKNHFCDWIFK